MQKQETKPVQHESKFCGKTFQRKDKLLRHAQTLHKAFHKVDFEAASSSFNESMKCQMCCMDFGTEKEKLYAHIASKVCLAKISNVSLNKDDPYACMHSMRKSYLDKDSLMKHTRWKHSSNNPMN